MHNIKELSISGRKILQRPATDPAASKGTMVILHGYGADEYDLMGLASYFDANLQILSVRGPGEVMNGGASWFDIGMHPDGSLKLNADQARQSSTDIVSLIHTLQNQGIIEDEKLIIGGFSQGGSIAQLVTLKEPELIQALLIMSGRYMEDATDGQVESHKIAEIPVFAGHGTFDNVIEIEYGRQIFSLWGKLSSHLDHHEYPMGHEICQDELGDIKNWMDTQVLNK